VRPWFLAAASIALAAGASAADTAADAVRRQAGVLQRQVKPLRAVNDAPQLSAQLGDLNDALDALARDDRSAAAGVGPVREASSALQAAIGKAKADGGPLGEKFCRDAADKVEKISGDASALLDREASGGPAAATPRSPAVEESLAEGLRTSSARIRARLAASAGFDSAAAEPAPAPSSIPEPVPLPRPRDVARKAKPAYSDRTLFFQDALNSVRRASKQTPIAADGYFGGGTDKAVRDFQAKNGLTVNGVVDRDTENALLARVEDLKKTAASAEAAKGTGSAGDYYDGSPSDFDPTPKQTVIKGALATIYTPYLARTRKQKRMEGPPQDRFEQTICTLERHLAGSCPYVSVAIDRRLNVPNGTPLLIPEISDLVGRPVDFRIVDTGSPKHFRGAKHVDIATDSGDDAGLGSLISGLRFTLVLPQGLRP
jgi:peptidoglycan hydrolase-like protein with peptidoglycan-binding domain